MAVEEARKEQAAQPPKRPPRLLTVSIPIRRSFAQSSSTEQLDNDFVLALANMYRYSTQNAIQCPDA